ncbi:MAG: hypothetical protein ACE5O2_02285 [Armatimonadota bacterium]
MLRIGVRREPQGDWTDKLYRPLPRSASEAIDIRLIPLFTWANRGASQMTVWMPLAAR